MDIFEVRRKIFHMAGGIGIIALIYFGVLNALILVFLILFMVFLSLLSTSHKIPVLDYLLDKLERPRYRHTFPMKSMIFFVAGALIVLALFSREIAIASLVILTLGDGFSALIGIHYGRIKHPFSNIKFIEGNIAGVMAASIGIMLMYMLKLTAIWPLHAFIASSLAMFFEGIEIKWGWDAIADDNITIPLISGAILWLFSVL